MIFVNPYCKLNISRMWIILFFACILPLQVMAKQGLAKEVAINDGLITISMADTIRNACPDISARLIEAFIYLKSLESEALKLGYNNYEIKAFINDAEEKDRILDLAEVRLKKIGVLPDQPRTYCTVGLAEIQIGSAIGKLLKVK